MAQSLWVADRWARKIVMYSQSRIGEEGIDVYLKFMLEDGPDEMGIRLEEKSEFQSNMCLYIASLLKDHSGILAKSQFASRFVEANGVSIYENALHLKQLEMPLATADECTRAILNSCGLLVERGRYGDIYDIFMISSVNEKTMWCLYNRHRFLNFQLKIALLNKLCELNNSHGDEVAEQKLRNLDAYFMSLAILGRDAENIHYVDDSGNPVRRELKESDVKTCVPQSLLDPDFSFKKFISAGPISMFYESPSMVREMILVCSYVPPRHMSNASLISAYGLTLTFMVNNHSFHCSPITALCRLHEVERYKSKKRMLDDLKLKIGDKVEDPVQAFTRPF